jgi:hypothetical protein
MYKKNLGKEKITYSKSRRERRMKKKGRKSGRRRRSGRKNWGQWKVKQSRETERRSFAALFSQALP